MNEEYLHLLSQVNDILLTQLRGLGQIYIENEAQLSEEEKTQFHSMYYEWSNLIALGIQKLQEGDYLEALSLTDEAVLLYGKLLDFFITVSIEIPVSNVPRQLSEAMSEIIEGVASGVGRGIQASTLTPWIFGTLGVIGIAYVITR